ncbi:HAD-IA family hydrolase [Allocoleopsis franciscana]|uniref:Haloacid dehalogenase superfamily enzyme, subfamily IA n=1 Tax=Allocoleopsis franciscana PCC 7113 TaxID=1173027 RepID=K9WKM0_9CYAN|nr:HAD-IA family hydrolase [Allocoleopsis franciscana]AFZ20361.1 haloacid dehalogenase superfamily enzyme, subfamily IA [Allocoleopsis franciscana PCC 7113]
MNTKVIIFDFDGTLADTFDAFVMISNRLALEFGYPPTTPEEIPKLRNLSSREIIKKSGISLFKMPFLLKKVREYLHQEILNLKTIPGIQDALIQLKHEGYCLGILTSNSEENVKLFLKKHGMQDLFSFIYSENSLFSKDKSLLKLMKKNNLRSDDLLYVGDETRDIEASKKIQIKVIAVTWGFNSGEVLTKHNPDFLIEQPSELIEVLGSLQQIVS